jgi:uncharacterized protein YndB with AHSA1/START domain
MPATVADSSRTAEREIVITRVLNAPRKLVFQAWTDPEHLMQWWGPKGFNSFTCDSDRKAGGKFRLQMRGPDGATHACHALFREIVEPERIVFEGPADGSGCGAGIPPRSTVTVTFVENAGKTTVTITTLLQSVEDREAAAKMGIIPGWNDSFDRLAEMLESRAGSA